MIIIMNNLSTHIDQRVVDFIERAGHLVCFLPSYSSDFNLIELTFFILKSWIWCYYYFVWQVYSNFDDFLHAVIVQSQCDWFARQQFRHAAGDVYIEQEELECLREQLAAYERGEVDIEFDTEVDMNFDMNENVAWTIKTLRKFYFCNFCCCLSCWLLHWLLHYLKRKVSFICLCNKYNYFSENSLIVWLLISLTNCIFLTWIMTCLAWMAHRLTTILNAH